MPEKFGEKPKEIPESAETKNVWDDIFKKNGEVFVKPQEDMPRIEKVFEEKGVKRVLDLGCGSGRHSVYLAENGFDVYGIDVAPEGIEITKKRLETKKLKADLKVGDIYTKLPYADDFFEAIISTQALHHNTIEKIRELIGEMERILTPKGIIFITVAKRRESKFPEKKIAERTFVPLSGPEKGLPHYYFDENTLREEFKDFTINDIWEESEGGHYCLLGELKKKN